MNDEAGVYNMFLELPPSLYPFKIVPVIKFLQYLLDKFWAVVL